MYVCIHIFKIICIYVCIFGATFGSDRFISRQYTLAPRRAQNANNGNSTLEENASVPGTRRRRQGSGEGGVKICTFSVRRLV